MNKFMTFLDKINPFKKAKELTLFILTVMAIVGILLVFGVGSATAAAATVTMARFTSFLAAYSPFFIALITSISVNSGIKKLQTKNKEMEVTLSGDIELDKEDDEGVVG